LVSWFRYAIYTVAILVTFNGCRKPLELPPAAYDLNLPLHFPEMPIPAHNPITIEKVNLGRTLFFDPRLSIDNTVSCSSCHKQAFAMSDDVQFSVGVGGQHTLRNSTPLFNLGFHPNYFRDGGSPTLELQVKGPIENPLEMNIAIADLAVKLNQLDEYRQLTHNAFGNYEVTPYTITRGLASYMRTLISGNSRYDQFVLGNQNALTVFEKQGLALFEGKAKCASCHHGFNLTNFSFENNGLYENYPDPGRQTITSNPQDNGKYRVASLRNVAITYPYMHDGSLATLEEVIEHYNQGGKNHPLKSELIQPLGLAESEKSALLAFLMTLTDNEFAE
jgi:cytochrome c peroxidase